MFESRRLFAASVIGFAILLAAGAGFAELRVILKDGRVLTLPVNPGEIQSITITEGVAPPAGEAAPLFRDDFRRGLGPGWSLEGNPAGIGFPGNGLLLPVRAGDLWQHLNNPPFLLLRPAPEGDFTLEARIFIEARQDYQQVILLAYYDLDNHVRLARSHIGGQRVELGVEEGGRWSPRNYPFGPPWAFLRMVKEGDQFTGFASSDGVRWQRLHTVRLQPRGRLRVGLTAFSGGGRPEGPPALVDYFLIR